MDVEEKIDGTKRSNHVSNDMSSSEPSLSHKTGGKQGFETGSTKVYVSIQAISYEQSSSLIQIGCVNSRSEEQLELAIIPSMDLISLASDKLFKKLHYRKRSPWVRKRGKTVYTQENTKTSAAKDGLHEPADAQLLESAVGTRTGKEQELDLLSGRLDDVSFVMDNSTAIDAVPIEDAVHTFLQYLQKCSTDKESGITLVMYSVAEFNELILALRSVLFRDSGAAASDQKFGSVAPTSKEDQMSNIEEKSCLREFHKLVSKGVVYELYMEKTSRPLRPLPQVLGENYTGYSALKLAEILRNMFINEKRTEMHFKVFTVPGKLLKNRLREPEGNGLLQFLVISSAQVFSTHRDWFYDPEIVELKQKKMIVPNKDADADSVTVFKVGLFGFNQPVLLKFKNIPDACSKIQYSAQVEKYSGEGTSPLFTYNSVCFAFIVLKYADTEPWFYVSDSRLDMYVKAAMLTLSEGETVIKFCRLNPDTSPGKKLFKSVTATFHREPNTEATSHSVPNTEITPHSGPNTEASPHGEANTEATSHCEANTETISESQMNPKEAVPKIAVGNVEIAKSDATLGGAVKVDLLVMGLPHGRKALKLRPLSILVQLVSSGSRESTGESTSIVQIGDKTKKSKSISKKNKNRLRLLEYNKSKLKVEEISNKPVLQTQLANIGNKLDDPVSGYNAEDIFMITNTKSKSLTIVNQIFCVLEDGTQMARLVLVPSEDISLSTGTILGHAVQINSQNFPQALVQAYLQDIQVFNLMQPTPKELEERKREKEKQADKRRRKTESGKENENQKDPSVKAGMKRKWEEDRQLRAEDGEPQRGKRGRGRGQRGRGGDGQRVRGRGRGQRGREGDGQREGGRGRSRGRGRVYVNRARGHRGGFQTQRDGMQRQDYPHDDQRGYNRDDVDPMLDIGYRRGDVVHMSPPHDYEYRTEQYQDYHREPSYGYNTDPNDALFQRRSPSFKKF